MRIFASKFQAHVEYETENRHYAHVDCPGHADYVKVGFFSNSANIKIVPTSISTGQK